MVFRAKEEAAKSSWKNNRYGCGSGVAFDEKEIEWLWSRVL